jgi:hypothetical protein
MGVEMVVEMGSKALAPIGQVLRHRHLANERVPGLVIFLLQRQCLVVDEPTQLGASAKQRISRACSSSGISSYW